MTRDRLSVHNDFKTLSRKRGNMILDVGCGSGLRFRAMPRGSANCDIDKPIVKIRNFVRCDARFLPFISDSFSLVLMFNLLEHIKDYWSAINEGLRVGEKILVRLDCFLVLAHLLTPDHEYFTIGFRFLRVPDWWRTFRVRFRFVFMNRYINFSFNMISRLLYGGSFWHHYLIEKNLEIRLFSEIPKTPQKLDRDRRFRNRYFDPQIKPLSREQTQYC